MLYVSSPRGIDNLDRRDSIGDDARIVRMRKAIGGWMRFTGAALIGLFLFCTGAAQAENGWTLTQYARGGAALSGQMTLYITPNGMRTYDPKNGVSLMTHGPSWQVYIYNSKTKRMFQSALNPWLQSFKSRGLAGRFQGASWRRGNTNGVVAGVRAYEFVMDKPPAVRTNNKTINGKVKQVAQMQSANLWVASDIATPTQVSNILSSLYGIPDSQRVPLRVQVLEQGARAPSSLVDTLRVQQGNIPDATFAVPTGMTSVRQDADVFIDQESMDTLDEMLQDLDSPSPKRRPPGTPVRR